MLFKELVLENFGSYYGRNAISLVSEDRQYLPPIVLFGGMNGGGKTTLIDAIRLTLYGQRAQCSTRGDLGYVEFLNQCVNREVVPDDTTRVELLFEHLTPEGWRELRIVRAWKKDPKEGKDRLAIYENEWSKDEALANTWDEYIEALFPLGISNLFLFDGEQVKELAELDEPPTTAIEAIDNLLGLELAERLSSDLDILVNRKRKEAADSSQLKSIEDIEAKLREYEREAATIAERLQVSQNNWDIARSKKTEAENRFRSEGGKIAAEKGKLDSDKRYVEKHLEDLRRDLRQQATNYLPLLLINSLLEKAKERAERELKSIEAEVIREAIERRDNDLLAYLDELKLDLEIVNKIKWFLQQQEKKLNVDEEPLLNADKEDLEGLINFSKNIAPSLKQNTADTLDKIERLEKELDNLDRQLAIAASPEAYDLLAEERDRTIAEELQTKAIFEETKKKYQEIDRIVKQTQQELENYSQKEIDVRSNQQIIDSIEKVKATLAIFKERLTLKKLNRLESEVTECFRYLLHKSDLVHRVIIATNTYSLSLYDPEGKQVPKNRLSAGEKQLLAIAFLWGLARVSGKNLPIAIDTPLGRLDSSHRHNLVERYFPAASHQVILLSTDAEIGKTEVEMLREQESISLEYLLKYEPDTKRTSIERGYFW
jgi:DNA sulfur modification protein DndD